MYVPHDSQMLPKFSLNPNEMLRLSAFLIILLTFIACVALAAQSKASYRHHGPAVLNDLTITPGLVRTTDVKEICQGGSTKQFRKTTAAMKRQVCSEYGMKDCPHQGIMEIDHLIPLEAGGADDIGNLWPQMANPKPGFHEKDKLENWLHRQICMGKMTPEAAQSAIAADWYALYLKAGLATR